MAGPMPGPKKKLKGSPLYLLPEEWERMDALADFHSEAFALLKWKEKVSRNDLLRYFLVDWAEKAYWDQVGGPPTSKEDRKKKVERLAELLKKQFGEQGSSGK